MSPTNPHYSPEKTGYHPASEIQDIAGSAFDAESVQSATNGRDQLDQDVKNEPLPEHRHSIHTYWQEKVLEPGVPAASAMAYQARHERATYYFDRFTQARLPAVERIRAARSWYRGLGQENDVSGGGAELLAAGLVISNNDGIQPEQGKRLDWSEYRLNAIDMLTEAARDTNLDRQTRRLARSEANGILQKEITHNTDPARHKDPLDRLQTENSLATRKQQLQLDELADQFQSGEITAAQLEKNITTLLLAEGKSLQANIANHTELQKRALIGNRGDRSGQASATLAKLSEALGTTFERHYLFMYRNMLLEREDVGDIANVRMATLRQDRALIEGGHGMKNRNIDVTVPVNDRTVNIQLKKDITYSDYDPNIVTIYPGLKVTYGPNNMPNPPYDVQVLNYFKETCTAMRVNTAFLSGQTPNEALLTQSEALLQEVRPAILMPQAAERSKQYLEQAKAARNSFTGRVAVLAGRQSSGYKAAS